MTRTQISLTEEQHQFLVKTSHQTGKSISAIIRKAVDQLRVEEEKPINQALRLIGAFKADRHDVSVRHDDILWGSGDDDEEDNGS